MSKNKQELCMGCMKKKAKSPICPYCGFDSEKPTDLNYLPLETQLESGYIIGKLLHNNGESAQYIAYDSKKDKTVIIREYFPQNIVKRNLETLEIEVKAGRGAQYKALMADFVDLFNDLKKYAAKQPIAQVIDIIEEHNTVYVVLEYLDALTLDEYLIAHGGKLDQEEALNLLVPLFNCIDNLHTNGIIHRGISPFTIFVDKRNKAIISDFSIPSNRTGGSEIQAEIFSGFSAPEQYLSTGWQGTWTDVYALGALLYRVISGTTSAKSIRVNKDNPVAELSEIVSDLEGQVSLAIKNAMNTMVNKRTQTVGVFLSEIYSEKGDYKTEIFDVGRIAVSIPKQTSFKKPNSKIEPLRAADKEFFDSFEFEDDLSGATISQPVPELYNNYKQDSRSQESDRNREFDFSYDVGQEEQAVPNNKFRRMIPLILIATALIIGVVMAVFFTNKLGLGSKNNNKKSIIEQIEVPVTTPAPENNGAQEAATGDETVVPDVIGKKWAQVEFNSEYTDLYRFEAKEEFNEDHDKDVIYEQKPKAGTKMPKGSTVVLTVSKGYIEAEMPDLLEKEEEEAKQELLKLAESMSIKYEDIEIMVVSRYSNIVEEGKVISTKPVAGEKFNPLDDKVEIVIAIAIPQSQVEEKTPPPTVKPPTTSTAPTKDKNGTDGNPNIDNLPRA